MRTLAAPEPMVYEPPMVYNHRHPMELRGTTVLVVEDDQDTREVMRAMLELCGATVLVAESARTGLDAFEKARPDVIVSDIAMPGEDGYWLVREVARRMNARDVPAVAVTAFSGEHRREAALAAGFRAHLAKPVDPDVLCRTVAEVMTPD